MLVRMVPVRMVLVRAVPVRAVMQAMMVMLPGIASADTEGF